MAQETNVNKTLCVIFILQDLLMIKMQRKDSYASPTYVIHLKNQIFAVEFSPYDWSQNLICIGFSDKITVASVKFPEEDEDLDDYDFQILREFRHQSRVDALSWSPKTALSLLPKHVQFASASSDFTVRVYYSNLASEDTVKILKGHTDYVNALAYSMTGIYLASASDDHTCKVWAIEDEQNISLYSTLNLTSAGISVCCHPEEDRLLVAEKCGLVRMYNMLTGQSLLSFEVYLSPLMSADWASSDSMLVAAVAASEMSIWNISTPSRPVETRAVHGHGARFVKFSPLSDSYIGTVGEPEHLLQVTHINRKTPVLISKLDLVGGLTWHFRLPYVCVGNDRKLCLWKIAIK